VTLKVRRKFIDWVDQQIHLRFTGEPCSDSAIICLHMMPKSSRGFEALMPELAENHFVLALDFPGCGESSHFPIGHVPSISDYADSVEHVIKVQKLKNVYLIGYHTGSMVAVELGNRLTGHVKKIICIGAPICDQAEIDEYLEYFAPIPLDIEGTRVKIIWERIIQFRGPGFTLEMGILVMTCLNTPNELTLF